MKEIAVQGATVGHSSGSVITGGTFSILTTPSIDVTITGKDVYRGTINIQCVGCSSGSFQIPIAQGTITGTSMKVKANGQAVILKGDKGTISGTGTDPSTGATSEFSGSVEITDTVQNKVVAN